MFEGPLHVNASEESGSEAPILRQLRWTDLVARLAATRGIREVAHDAGDDQHASFNAFHLGGEEKGQRYVNRDALAHGKLTRVGSPHTADNAGEGDQET